VTIGDQPPTINVSFTTLAAASSKGCVQASVSAAPGRNGAPLSSVQYSTDGGNTYTGILLSQLPLTFILPGTGAVTVVFSATDTSNQIAAQSASFNFGNGCSSLTVPNVAGLAQAAATTAISTAGLVVGTVTTAASSTVSIGSVISQNPGPGTVIAPGSSAAVSLVISTGAAPGANACAIINGVSVSVSDVQQAVNEALGVVPTVNDLNHDGLMNVIDVQIVIGAAMGMVCLAR